MRTIVLVVLAPLLFLGCASTKPEPPSMGLEIPEGPVRWPVGSFTFSGRLEYRIRNRGSTAPPPAQAVNGDLLVASDGSVTVSTGFGTCVERDTKRAAARSFSCGDASISLITDGEVIRGWMSLGGIMDEKPSGEQRCKRWRTDDQGRRTCIEWEQRPGKLVERTLSGEIRVTRRGS